MQQTSTPVVGPVLLAFVAVLSCLAFATGTVTITRSEFTWAADRTGDAAPLVLAAQSPETLSASGPCSAAASPSPVDLLTTGDPAQNTLTVRAHEGKAWMTYLGMQASDVLTVPEDCTLSVAYQRADNTAVLTAGESRTSAALVPVAVGYDRPDYRQFAVTRLAAAPGFTATVTTQPTTFSSSAWRLIWLLTCAGSLVALGWLLKSGRPGRVGRAEVRRWAGPDTLVAVTGAIALIAVPPRFDDGWVLTTVRQYDELGFFSNYYSIDAAAQPQGFWWTWVERLWLDPMWSPGFLLRLPTVLILVGTWWFLRRQVLAPAGVRGPALWCAAVVACTGLVGLQITIRPEPLVALLLVAAISVVVRYAATHEPFLLVVLGGLSALAISVHQTGWCVVTASAAVLPWAWQWLRQRRNAMVAVAIAVCSASLALILAMLGSNASLWSRSIRLFRQDTTTYQSLLDEGARITALTRFDNPSVTIVAVGLLMLAAVGFLLRPERGDVAVRAAGWSAMAAIGGLLLTTSKLVDHYAAVVPAAAVLAGLALQEMRVLVAVGATFALAGLGLVAFGQPGVWALGLDRASSLDMGALRVLAIVLLAVTVLGSLLALTRRRWRPARVAAVPLVGLAALSALLSLVPVVFDGLRQPGAWFGQQVASVQGRTCGLLDAVSLREAAPSLFDNPQMSQGVGQTPPARRPSAWVRGSLFGLIRVDVVTDGATTGVTLPPSHEVWSMVPFTGDFQVGSVRWTDPAMAVVSGSEVPEHPAVDGVRTDGDSWWVEPGLALQAPCVTSVDIRDGALPSVRYSVGHPAWVGSGLLTSTRPAYESGCAGDAGAAQGRCIVTLTPGSDQPPTLEEVREQVS